MKTNGRKAVSLLSVLAMSASFAVPAVHADTTKVGAGTTTLEMENYTASNEGFTAYTGDAFHGGGWVIVGPNTGDGSGTAQSQSFSMTFTADAGKYDLDIGVGERGACDWASPVKMSVNGTDYGYFWKSENSADAFSWVQYLAVSNDVGGCKFGEYQSKNAISLKNGENTIEFTFETAYNNSYVGAEGTVRFGTDHVYGGLDYITFTQKEAAALNTVEDGTTLELETVVEDMADFGNYAVSGCQGGAAAYMNTTRQDVEEQEFVLKINAKEAGDYQLEIGASERGAADWASPMKLSVNGTSYGWFWTADNLEDGFTRSDVAYANHNGFNFAKYNTKSPLRLNKGENTLTFTLYSSKDNGYYGGAGLVHYVTNPVVYGGLDYIKFQKEKEVTVTYGTTLEMEKYASANSAFGAVTAEGASNGSAVYMPGTDYTNETATFEVEFTAEEAGEYMLEIGASERGANDFISPVQVKVNDTDFGYLWNANNSADRFTRSSSGYTSYAGFGFAKYNSVIPANLVKGTNKIVFTAVRANGNGWIDGEGFHYVNAGALVYAGFDYITFTKPVYRKVQSGTNVELEEFLNENPAFGKDEYSEESDGAAAAIFQSNVSLEDTAEYTFKVDVEEAGNYYLEVGASDRGTADYLSAVSVKLNQTELGFLRGYDYETDTFVCEQEGYAQHDLAGYSYKFNRYVKSATVPLEKGINTLTFVVHNAQKNTYEGVPISGIGSQIIAALDYMKFTKEKTLANPRLSLTDTLSVDGVAYAEIYDGEKKITADDVSQITYSSSLESVATVNGEGKVTGVRAGRTQITVSITVNPGQTPITLNRWVVVTEDEMYVANVQIADDGKVSFEVYNNTEWDDYEKLKAIVASYDENGKLTAVASDDIVLLECGGYAACNVELDGYQGDEDVYIYVWDGFGTMSPVMSDRAEY